MGTRIDRWGSVEVDKMPKSFLKKAKDIKDEWGSPAFFVDEDDMTIEFESDSIEGCTPYMDGVDKPLEELISVAEKTGVKLNGEFQIWSDCSDYDNVTIKLEDNRRSELNTAVINASTEALVDELISRDVIVDAYDAVSRSALMALLEKGVLVSNGNYKSVKKAIDSLPPVCVIKGEAV